MIDLRTLSRLLSIFLFLLSQLCWAKSIEVECVSPGHTASQIPTLECNQPEVSQESLESLQFNFNKLLDEIKETTNDRQMLQNYLLNLKKMSYGIEKIQQINAKLGLPLGPQNPKSLNGRKIYIDTPRTIALKREKQKSVIYLKNNLDNFLSQMSQEPRFSQNIRSKFTENLKGLDPSNRGLFCQLIPSTDHSNQANQANQANHEFSIEPTQKQINGTYFETAMAINILDHPGDAGKAITSYTKDLAGVIDKIMNFPKTLPKNASESMRKDFEVKVKLRNQVVKTLFNEGLRPMELPDLAAYAQEKGLSPAELESIRKHLKPGDQIGRYQGSSAYFDLKEFKEGVGFEPSLAARAWLTKMLTEDNRPGESLKMQTKIKSLSGFGTLIYAMRPELKDEGVSQLLSQLLTQNSKEVTNARVQERTEELLRSVRTTAFDSSEMRKRIERSLTAIDGIDMDKLQTTDASSDGKGMGLIYNGGFARLRINNDTPSHAGSPSLKMSPTHPQNYRFTQGGGRENPQFSQLLDPSVTDKINRIKGQKPNGKFRLTPDFREAITSEIQKVENAPELYRPFGAQEESVNALLLSAIGAAGGENSISRKNAPITNPKLLGTVSQKALDQIPFGYKALGVPELLKEKALSHGVGINRWIPIGKYSIESQKHGFPSAGAHSGGTSDIFMAINALGKKSIIQDKENAEKAGLLISAFMTSGGYHTFIETDPIAESIAQGKNFEIKVTETQEKNLYANVINKVIKYCGASAQELAPKFLAESELSNLILAGTPAN
jgi:hypothetical protein